MKNQSKERPILFSSPMVKAILEGRKTQTRRIIKPQPAWRDGVRGTLQNGNGWHFSPKAKIGLSNWEVLSEFKLAMESFCPYGQPGDKLWVRETHKVLKTTLVGGSGEYEKEVRYKADEKSPHAEVAVKLFGGWKPSIHMPRWASRIDLEVVKVRVERLQEISEEDAKAEGAPLWPSTNFEGPHPVKLMNHKTGFFILWEKINGLKSWNANPWVWVLEFKRVRP